MRERKQINESHLKNAEEDYVRPDGRAKSFVGAAILIALGILIILSNSGIYGFDKSWPILLIVIAVAMLVQRSHDIGAWLIGIVGAGFFVMKNFFPDIEDFGKYILPALMIALGIYILFNKKRGKNIS